ncbi:MAG: Rossmann-like domain-containing protein [bacterium]
MKVLTRLEELFAPAAARATVSDISIGLGYTAVTLEDGRIGIAYTYLDAKGRCSLVDDQEDYEGEPAALLLRKLSGENYVERSVALAAVNALNHTRAFGFPEDRGTMLDDLGVAAGDVVAMVGYFQPVADRAGARGATVRAYDMGKGIGDGEEFYRFLRSGAARALVVTSTSVIGGTTESVLAHLPAGTPCAMIGPTTPMVPEAFDHLPITYFGGTLPLEGEPIVKAVRQGRGTKAIHNASRKVCFRPGVDPAPPLE